jgi:hypothetical protein
MRKISYSGTARKRMLFNKKKSSTWNINEIKLVKSLMKANEDLDWSQLNFEKLRKRLLKILNPKNNKAKKSISTRSSN